MDPYTSAESFFSFCGRMSVHIAGGCQDELIPYSYMYSSPEGSTGYFFFLYPSQKLGMLLVRGLQNKDVSVKEGSGVHFELFIQLMFFVC